MDDVNPYAELAQITNNLKSYRLYREQAKVRRDEAIAEEDKNIQYESERIEGLELRIRELVAELGLA